MPELAHQLQRSVVINAEPASVFRYFTDSARWASWWGPGSTIDARPGGQLVIRYPGNVEASGEVVEVHPPKRLVFTYGYASGTPIPVGASRVTIDLEPAGPATLVQLTHEFADAAVRDTHVQGWRYQLSLFSNVVSNEMNSGAADTVDAWFDAWANPDASTRDEVLSRIAEPDVRFRDRFSNTDGLADLSAHITASQMYMPGIRLHRIGDVRQCQGTALADWVARGPDGNEVLRGTNVVTFSAGGHISSVTGIPMPSGNSQP